MFDGTPLTDQADWERRMERALATGYGLRRDLSGFPGLWFADRAVNGPWLDRLRALRHPAPSAGSP